MTTTRKVTTFEMEGGSGGGKVTSSISRSGGGEVIMKGQTGGGSLEITKVKLRVIHNIGRFILFD